MTRRYDISELLKFAVSIEPSVDYSSQANKLHESDLPKAPKTGQSASFHSIRAGCPWANSAMERAAASGYDEWRTGLQILSRCENGEALAHDVSRPHPDYDYGETAAKFAEARDNMSPPTCHSIRYSLGASECEACPGQVSGKSPMQFSFVNAEVAALQSQYVMDVQTGRFFPVAGGQPDTPTVFNNRFNHLTKHAAASTLVNSKTTGKVEREEWLPGDVRRIFQVDQKWVVNSWIDDGVQPVEGDCELSMQLIERLVPDPEDREAMLDMIAFHLQNPAVKIKSGWILQGCQGSGKGSFSDLMAAIVGRSNYKEIGPDELRTNWNASWGNRQVGVIDELMTKDQIEGYNNLKRWLTEDQVVVEEKFLPRFSIKTPRLWFALTNYRLSLPLPDDDRRFNVVNSPSPPLPQVFVKPFRDGFEQQASAFKWSMLNRNVELFDPGASARLTEAKRQLIEDSKCPVERVLGELFEARSGPFKRDWVRFQEVREAVRCELLTFSERKLTEAMRSMGMVKRQGQIDLPELGKARLWVVRNHSKWKGATQEDIQQHWAEAQ